MSSQPSFFIIGAPKCGTTSLTDWLAHHPELWLPEKEIEFFNTDHKRRGHLSLSGYEALFHGDKLSGDSSVWYLYSNEAVPNILRYNPDAKFIVCLRDPVEMAFSLHNQLVFSLDENVPDLRNAWLLEAERRNGAPVSCYERSFLFYSETCALGKQVARLLTHTKNVHFVFLEDMRSAPQAVYDGVLKFLGASGATVQPTHKNPASGNRSRILRRFVASAVLVKRKLGIRGGLGLLGTLNRWNVTASPWSRDEEFEKQLRFHFMKDIKLLAKVTKRDLSHWLQDPL